jgi:hypothetical protein
MKALILLLIFSILYLAVASGQTTEAGDSVAGLLRPFGVGGRACKQYDDTGRLYILSESYPSIAVIVWLQQSDGGTKPGVPMPQELADALPYIPGCILGKHHAAPQAGLGRGPARIDQGSINRPVGCGPVHADRAAAARLLRQRADPCSLAGMAWAHRERVPW